MAIDRSMEASCAAWSRVPSRDRRARWRRACPFVSLISGIQPPRVDRRMVLRFQIPSSGLGTRRREEKGEIPRAKGITQRTQSTLSPQRRGERKETVSTDFGFVDVLPRSLHCVADAPNDGAAEKIGHSGRDDRGEIEKRRGHDTSAKLSASLSCPYKMAQVRSGLLVPPPERGQRLL